MATDGLPHQAWSPMKNCPFDDTSMKAIAAAHNVTVAQVCLRWILERGCTLAVGTGDDPDTVAKYTAENLDLFNFTLAPAEMREIHKIASRRRRAL